MPYAGAAYAVLRCRLFCAPVHCPRRAHVPSGRPRALLAPHSYSAEWHTAGSSMSGAHRHATQGARYRVIGTRVDRDGS
jgi:hypothetical protein